MRSITLFGVLGLLVAIAAPSYGQVELYHQALFTYDDSWQTKAEWDDCSFCIPHVTVRERALRHEMTLVVTGPDEQYVRNAVNTCMQEATAVGVLAALAAVYTDGAAMPAAWGAFEEYFLGCVSEKGAGAVSAEIEDRSHWTDWN